MSKASKIISESILGEYVRNIEIGGKWYDIQQPTIPTIARIVKHWSNIDIKDDYNKINIISAIPINSKHIINGIAKALAGTGVFSKLKYVKYKWIARKMTTRELRYATETIIDLIKGEDFFVCASLAKNATMLIAKQKR